MNAQCRWPNDHFWLPEDQFPVESARQHAAAAQPVAVEQACHIAHRVELALNPAAGRRTDWSVWSGCWPTCWRKL